MSTKMQDMLGKEIRVNTEHATKLGIVPYQAVGAIGLLQDASRTSRMRLRSHCQLCTKTVRAVAHARR
jgi:hypothetical protein